MRSFYDSFGFKQLINEPTRVTLDTKTLIDHIATTDPKNIVNSGVIRLGISDHYAVFCVRKFMGKLLKSPKTFVTRQLKNVNKNAFIEALNRVYCDDLLDVDDPTIMEQLWTRVFVGILDKHAPVLKHLKHNSKNIYSPFVTSELIRKRRARDVLKTRAVETSSEVLMQAYRNLINQINRENNRLKRVYFSRKIYENDGNIKETWNTINKLVDRRSKTTEIPYLDVCVCVCVCVWGGGGGRGCVRNSFRSKTESGKL